MWDGSKKSPLSCSSKAKPVMVIVSFTEEQWLLANVSILSQGMEH